MENLVSTRGMEIKASRRIKKETVFGVVWRSRCMAIVFLGCEANETLPL